GELLVCAPAGVTRILGLDKLRRSRLVHVVPLTVHLVEEAGAEAVDVAATFVDAEEAEHVIEGPVLHHQDDDVVDLLEVLDCLVQSLRPFSCGEWESTGDVDKRMRQKYLRRRRS